MNLSIATLVSALLLGIAAPAAAQSSQDGVKSSARERAIKRCKENRGTDCESKEGLREWLREERPISREEQQAAAGARRHREQCAKNKNGVGC